MALKIRLQRGGATHAPHYRVVVADSRSRRDGRFVEIIGTYDPRNKSEDKQVNIKLDRADYWVGVGAQPSDTVRSLIKKVRRNAPQEEAQEAVEVIAVEAEAEAEASAPAQAE
jgi:small subunit ribosomal protein S16